MNVLILTVNLLFSTFVFWVAARLYLLPKLDQCEPRTVLMPILLLHGMRHLGLMFLAPGAVYAGVPPQFAYPAAFGDLAAAVLALIALPAVATRIGSPINTLPCSRRAPRRGSTSRPRMCSRSTARRAALRFAVP